MFVNALNYLYGFIQQYHSGKHWNNTPQTPNLTSFMARRGWRLDFLFFHTLLKHKSASCMLSFSLEMDR